MHRLVNQANLPPAATPYVPPAFSDVPVRRLAGLNPSVPIPIRAARHDLHPAPGSPCGLLPLRTSVAQAMPRAEPFHPSHFHVATSRVERTSRPAARAAVPPVCLD